MRNNILPAVIKVLGFILAIALAPAALALQVTLNVPNCQAVSFDPATNTLSCTGTNVTTPGSCSISSAPAAATQSGVGVSPGTSVTLTAFCATGATPITYTWNNSVTNNVPFNAPAAQTNYTVTTSNASGSGPTLNATVYIAGSGGTAPANCTISQSPNTAVSPVNAGTPVTLTASCSGGSPVTSCAWSGNVPATSACSVSVTAPSANAAYSVTASNSYGSAPSVSTTIQVNTVSSGQNFCTGLDAIITVPWRQPGQSRQFLTSFGNQKLALKITVPSTYNPSAGTKGWVRSAETPGAPNVFREVTISRNSCDFQSGDYLYNGIGLGDSAPGFTYSVNTPNQFWLVGAAFNIQPGETVYMNIRNTYLGSPSCPSSSCDMVFEFATPP